MSDGFVNVTKKGGNQGAEDLPTLLWRRGEDFGQSERLYLSEDSGYDSNLQSRIVDMAKRCTGWFSGRDGAIHTVGALPRFDPGNCIEVTVRVVPAPARAAEEPVAQDVPAPIVGSFSKTVLATMNKATLSGLSGLAEDDATKNEHIAAILEKQAA